jgi:16S rRNA C967 or C1407 C5-methylase (RsmB/RsmF family)
MEALNPHTTPSTGLLIANDADAKRCHMLVHQTGRMPSIGLGVTCNDASKLVVRVYYQGRLMLITNYRCIPNVEDR